MTHTIKHWWGSLDLFLRYRSKEAQKNCLKKQNIQTLINTNNHTNIGYEHDTLKSTTPPSSHKITHTVFLGLQAA